MTDTFFNLNKTRYKYNHTRHRERQLYHIGIPFSGTMDKRNFLIANKLVDNNLKDAMY